jgi:hypothetical protein
MRFKELYLMETPIAYDDETSEKVGTIDSISKTKWGKAPSPKIGLYDLKYWVNNAIHENILTDITLGTGATKICKFNEDEKTVFKYNWNLSSYGNQIAKEVKIYKKYSSKYESILPKFYKWGDHWLIQEYVEPLKYNESVFKKVTGIDWNEWDSYCSVFHLAQLSWNEFHHPKDTILSTIKSQMKNASESLIIKINKILNNKNLYKIIEFCFKTKVSINDMHEGNLAFTKNRKTIKIIDFGI